MNTKLRKNSLSLAIIVLLFKMLIGFINYPLYIRFLTPFELSIFFLIISTGSIFELLDFNFTTNLIRYFSYAEGGISHLQKEGLAPVTVDKSEDLFSLLLIFSKVYYKILTVVAFIVIGIGFSIYLFYFTKIHGQAFLKLEVIWTIYCSGSLLTIYYMYLSPAMISKGFIDNVNRISLFAKIFGVVVQIIALFLGLGLFAIAIGAIATMVLERIWLFREFDSKFGLFRKLTINRNQFLNFFKTIWHSNFKLGLMTLAWLFIAKFNSFIAGFAIHDVNLLSEYLFTLQLFTIILSIAHVPISNNISDISTYYVQNKQHSIKIFLKNNALSIMCMVCFTLIIIFIGNEVLHLFHYKKVLLSNKFIILLGIIYVFEKQLVNHSTMISVGNIVPMYRAYLISAVIVFLVTMYLVFILHLGVLGLILPQLIGQGIFNYWYWVNYNLKFHNISYKNYLFSLLGK